MYYHLCEHCRLVAGACRGAIYDFATGKVYSINRGALTLLQIAAQSPLEEVLEDQPEYQEKTRVFLAGLTERGLGNSLNQPVADDPLDFRQIASTEIPLEFIWLELTSRCNNRCLHCYAASGPTCTNDAVPHERWLELIDEAKAAGASGIQLIGGEPLLYPRWRELVLKAREAGFSFIEIFSNATLLDDDGINFLKENNVNMATTIYADNPATHDLVTQNPGSFDRTMTAVHKILAANIPLRIASIIMKANEEQVEPIMKLCASLGLEATPPDPIRPTGRGDDLALQPLHYKRQPVRPPFFTDPISFEKNLCQHGCLAGKIAITAAGDVIPCIFARNQLCGTILKQSLAEVLSGQPLLDCWQTSKDRLRKCRDCEYRYACADCRPLAQSLDSAKDWLAPTAGCPYNPYTGKWEDDVSCQKNTE